MSDLQIGLVVVGAFVVAGVYLFNWRQERVFRRNSEQAFAREHADVLLQGAQSDAKPEPRVEPKIHAPAARAAADEPARPAGRVDPAIDYVFDVTMPAPRDWSEVREDLLALTGEWRKPLVVAGCDPASGEWTGVGQADDCAQLRFALQMSNRAGCVDQSQLTAFRDAVLKWAGDVGAQAKCSDVAEAHARAVELDRFCADVDVAIGVNVVAGDGNTFAGTKIRALAEASGLKLEPDGVFHARNDDGDDLFTLDNHEPAPFVPEQVKTMTTRGLTFVLDVPRTAAATEAFDAMLKTAEGFAATLGGVLVDDNRTPLSTAAVDKIRAQLSAILAQMDAGQVPAGGARARRLFS